jgi:hypothetical protein
VRTWLLLLLLLPVACVRSQDVPNIGVPPVTPMPASAAPQMSARPSALTLSASAVVPPYPSISVSQPGATAAPFLITAQSTCLGNGYLNLVATTTSAAASSFAFEALHTGSCVLDFGGTGGATLIVPVTITP